MNARARRRTPALAALLALGLLGARGQEPGIDPEIAAERKALAERSLREHCLMCHSVELIEGQRLSRAQWEAEVAKMIGWGAPVPAAEAGPLVDYLHETYGEAAAAYQPGGIAPAAVVERGRQEIAPIEGDPERGAALHLKHCATCHGPGGGGGDLGTNLVEKPILLDVPEYRAILQEGKRRMPGFRQVLGPDEDLDILAWLRTRRGP